MAINNTTLVEMDIPQSYLGISSKVLAESKKMELEDKADDGAHWTLCQY